MPAIFRHGDSIVMHCDVTPSTAIASDSDSILMVKIWDHSLSYKPGHVAQSVGHLTHKSGVLGSIPGLATYFRFSFRFFKKGSCQLLANVCAQSTG